MGDTPAQSGAPTEFPRQLAPGGTTLGPTSPTQPNQPQSQQVPSHPSGYPPMVEQQSTNSHAAFSSQFDMTQLQGPARPGPYNMSPLAAALPQANYRPGQYSQGPQSQRFGHPATPAASGVPSQMQAPPPLPPPLPPAAYGTQGAAASVPGPPYYHHHLQHAQMPQYYAAPVPVSQPQANADPRQNVAAYYPTSGMNQPPTPTAPYFYAQAQFPGQTHAMTAQIASGQYIPPTTQQGDARLPVAQIHDPRRGAPYGLERGGRSAEGHQNVVRGPPRKPKQSGHAIWIGNLPPQTDLMSLVHHICKQTGGLESLFLISKSNCAFANFHDEATCTTAREKLNNSRFQSVTLVTRVRRRTVEGTAGMVVPKGPAANAPQQAVTEGKEKNTEHAQKTTTEEAVANATPVEEQKPVTTADGQTQKDRFFILKSLTVEDLERSVQTNIWATQSHNENVLNEAFKNSENVYLIFSANKSGEYFGYARMVSPVNDDPAAAIELAPKSQPVSDFDLPKLIPTEATQWAPKGRIIDDSARGTIFWEVDRDDQAPESGGPEDDTFSGPDSAGGDAGSIRSGVDGADGEVQAWGKPFRLEWLSTGRLPFFQTRGLRNPWNANREVKIARDGTELEPSVGKTLISLFNRVQSPTGSAPRRPGAMRGPMSPVSPMSPTAMAHGFSTVRSPTYPQ